MEEYFTVPAESSKCSMEEYFKVPAESPKCSMEEYFKVPAESPKCSMQESTGEKGSAFSACLQQVGRTFVLPPAAVVQMLSSCEWVGAVSKVCMKCQSPNGFDSSRARET